MLFVIGILSTLVIGFLIGQGLQNSRPGERFVDPLLQVSIGLMLLMLGMRMGSNEEVIRNFGQIGLVSAIITVLLWIGGVAGVVIARKALGLDKYARMKRDAGSEEGPLDSPGTEDRDAEAGTNSGTLTTIVILVSVTAGLLLGYFLVRRVLDEQQYVLFDEYSRKLMMAGLFMLVFLIGYSMGLAGTVIQEIRKAGFRVFVIALSVIAGTTVMGVFCGLVLPQITLRESLAVSYGFGWFTYAPILIEGAGHEIAAAISFMHNVMRELFGIVLIPILARKLGYLEVCSLPGIASMDVGMPVVRQACREDIVIYGFVIGFMDELAAIVLMPLAIGA